MSSVVDVSEKNVDNKIVINNLKEYDIQVYKRRWYILALFIWYSAINGLQWVEYSSITNIVVKYYNVSTITVDWTSIIYMALYPIFVIPASYVINKKGLRAAGLLGCLGTAFGTCIKIFSVQKDLFWLVLLGQAIVSASQIVILCLPPKIAAIWFKPNEASKANALGVFGTQLGTSIGYLLPPAIVGNHDNIDDIGSDLKVLCWILAGSSIPVSIAVIAYFPNFPKKPPSISQAKEREIDREFETKKFFISIKDLFLNKAFVIHVVAFSINIGVFSGIGTLLAQFILFYFEGAQGDAGAMGFGMILTGMVGSIAFGIFLDKTRKFKESAIAIYFLSALGVVGFMYSLEYKSKLWSYISCGVMGVASSSYWSVGIELAMELTFPSEESTTAGILVAVTQVLGVIFATGLGYLNIYIGPFWSLGSQSVLLFIGTIITMFIPNDLRRQAVFAENQKQMFTPVPIGD
ncbi:unnamed protein product [Brassicogethes aeneus]|uniref:Major facilitator superfamily (MFS) profile domain-containing protein n=1 Tax=Brassicogethes aeneus TaxID=1431903 RepID=A0A9P0BAT1_BRAAE|nr:unnamed protein product [Brassicogethes aeneus]